MGQLISISVCLSDLPKDKIQTSEKNGKKYINLIVDERKEVSKFGETHTAFLSQSKEERESKTPKTYIGGGKEVKFERSGQNGTSIPPKQESAATGLKNDFADGLPFDDGLPF